MGEMGVAGALALTGRERAPKLLLGRQKSAIEMTTVGEVEGTLPRPRRCG